jgi:hypothetical protein
VSFSPNTDHRLARLARIIAESGASQKVHEGEVDSAVSRIESVPTERIARMTAEVRDGNRPDIDAIDMLAVRTLLDDYKTAVAQLRAALRITEKRIARAAGPVGEAERILNRRYGRGG